MFLLIILFGLAALGLAFALYLQADMQSRPLPPIKPPAISAKPAASAAPPDAAVAADNAAGSSTDNSRTADLSAISKTP